MTITRTLINGSFLDDATIQSYLKLVLTNFVSSGLTPTNGGGLNLSIAAGVGFVDGYRLSETGTTVGLPNSQPLLYVYLKEDGTYPFYATENTTVSHLLLAIVATSGGVITNLLDVRRINPQSQDQIIIDSGIKGLRPNLSVGSLQVGNGATIGGQTTLDGLHTSADNLFDSASAIAAWKVTFSRAIAFGLFQAYFGVKAVTTTYSVGTTEYIITADATGGPFTITLPTVVSLTGRQFTIVKIDSSGNAVTVARQGSDTIEGATSIALAAQNNKVTLFAAAANLWVKLGSGNI